MKQLNIIFDLDGTLWDSRKQISIAWNNVLKNLKYDIQFSSEELSNVMGLSNTEILVYLKNKGIKNKDFLHLCQQEEVVVLSNQGATLFPNVIKCIKSLAKKHNLYIVSNCQNGYIESFLNFYHLTEYFKDFLCADNIYKNKEMR